VKKRQELKEVQVKKGQQRGLGLESDFRDCVISFGGYSWLEFIRDLII
jgi:hypothetical protein